MNEIATIIPCYNERLTIGIVIRKFKRELPEAVIYVNDNNSTDNTSEIARDAGAIVRKETKKGKGNVIRRMFREIDAKCYLMVDGDDTYSPSTAKEMCELVIKDNIDMVIGDRLSSTYFEENKRLFHNIGNNIVKKSVNTIFNCDFNDIMTGYRAFSYLFAKTFLVLSKGFEIETEMSIHAIDKSLAMANVVIEYKDRQAGRESKLNTFLMVQRL